MRPNLPRSGAAASAVEATATCGSADSSSTSDSAFPSLPATMSQTAPYPDALADLVKRLAYRPGWRFWLEDADRDRDADGNVIGRGLTFVVRTRGHNSYKPSDGETYAVCHYFIVPAATYDERAWMRWLFDRLVDVETHECMEFFRIDKRRPYAPNHGPGRNPYSIIERGTEKDAHTRFTGDVVYDKGTV